MRPKMSAPILITAGLFLALVPGGIAQDARTNHLPHFAGQPPGSRQEILRKFEGVMIDAVNTNTMTLTIRFDDKPSLFKVTALTRFTRDRQTPANWDDVRPGKMADVTIKMVQGQPDEVVALNIKSK